MADPLGDGFSTPVLYISLFSLIINSCSFLSLLPVCLIQTDQVDASLSLSVEPRPHPALLLDLLIEIIAVWLSPMPMPIIASTAFILFNAVPYRPLPVQFSWICSLSCESESLNDQDINWPAFLIQQGTVILWQYNIYVCQTESKLYNNKIQSHLEVLYSSAKHILRMRIFLVRLVPIINNRLDTRLRCFGAYLVISYDVLVYYLSTKWCLGACLKGWGAVY